MTIEERAARAVELKAGCNCAQAVALAFADALPLDEATLMKLAAGYGARMARATLAGFQDRCGATICKDLKGIETGTVLCPCTECVRNAVLAAGEALGLE